MEKCNNPIIDRFVLDNDSTEGGTYSEYKRPMFSPITLSRRIMDRIRVSKKPECNTLKDFSVHSGSPVRDPLCIETLYTETFNKGEIKMSKEMVGRMIETLTKDEQRKVAIRPPNITRLDAMCEILGVSVFKERIAYVLEKYPLFIAEYRLANKLL